MTILQVLAVKRYKRQGALPKCEAFEEVAEPVESAPINQLPKSNSKRETHSQRQLRTQQRGKPTKQRMRNYAIKEEEGDFGL